MKYVKQRVKLINKSISSIDIDWTTSRSIMNIKQDKSNITAFTFKLRNSQLNGCVEMTRKIRKNANDLNNIRLQKIYKTTQCPFCHEHDENTKHIINDCKEWQNFRLLLVNKIDKYLLSLDININNNWIFNEKIIQKGFFPKRIRKLIKRNLKNNNTNIQQICNNIYITILLEFRHIYRIRCQRFFDLVKQQFPDDDIVFSRK